MNSLPSLEANAPLLLGTVRSLGNKENSDGDIVLVKVNVNGIDRVKIFQREHQNGLLKLLFRAYDSYVGNVNCTQHLENIDTASHQLRSASVTHHSLTSTLKNIRTQLEQSDTPHAGKIDLTKTLEDLQLVKGADKSSEVELGEPQWAADELIAMLKAAQRYSTGWMDETSLVWLANIRSDPQRVFTSHEKDRIDELADEALELWQNYVAENTQVPEQIKNIWLAHAKKNNLPEDGDIAKVVRRELFRLKDHAARRCINKVQGTFYKSLANLIRTKGKNASLSLNDLEHLCTALCTPDAKLQLANKDTLCTALAYLRSQWDVLKEDKGTLLELKPLLFEAKRAYAQEMKIPEHAAKLKRSLLKPEMLDRMVEDIRRSLSASA